MIVLECFPIGKAKAALRARKKKADNAEEKPSLTTEVARLQAGEGQAAADKLKRQLTTVSVPHQCQDFTETFRSALSVPGLPNTDR
jgi:hypothetical protein